MTSLPGQPDTKGQMTAAHRVPGISQRGDRKGVLTISSIAGVIGGLGCLAPIVLVLFGLATISVAADLGNFLYGEHHWAFRVSALGFLVAGLAVYFRKRGICTLDQAKRQRNRILNVSLLTLFGASGIYLFWTYIVLHYWGIAVGLPWSQYNEDWAIPTAAIILILFFLFLRRLREPIARAHRETALSEIEEARVPEGLAYNQKR